MEENVKFYTETIEFSPYLPLGEYDGPVFEASKKDIESKVREAFPSIPANFELKPVSVHRIQGCPTLFKFKVPLPDGKFAIVSVRPAGHFAYDHAMKMGEKPPQPTITVESA